LGAVVFWHELANASSHFVHNCFFVLQFVPGSFQFGWFQLFYGDKFLIFLVILRQLLQIHRTNESDICPSSIDVAKTTLVDWFVSPNHLLYFDFGHIVNKVIKLFLGIIDYQSKGTVQNFLVA
jgi:hypothetical protein